MARFMLGLTLLLVVMILFVFSFSPVYHYDRLAWGRERAGLYASRALVCLSCMLYSSSFSLPPSWCPGLAAACDCGTFINF